MKKSSLVIRADVGFTLLEVILAFTIFAILSAVLYGAFFVSHRAVEKAQSSFDDNQKFRAAIDLVGSYIRSSYPYRVTPQNPDVFYFGDEARLEFVSAFSVAQGGRGMAKIRLYAESTEDGGQVIQLQEEAPVRITQEQETGGLISALVLRERVSEFRLRYLDPQDDREQWLDRWDQNEHRGLPRAVRMSYREPDGHEVRWIFPVMVAVLAP